MSRWRKKPVIVEAEKFLPRDLPLPFASSADPVCCYADGAWFIETSEGRMMLTDGDWVVRGVRGEYYPVKPDIFMATYEPEPELQIG